MRGVRRTAACRASNDSGDSARSRRARYPYLTCRDLRKLDENAIFENAIFNANLIFVTRASWAAHARSWPDPLAPRGVVWRAWSVLGRTWPRVAQTIPCYTENDPLGALERHMAALQETPGHPPGARPGREGPKESGCGIGLWVCANSTYGQPRGAHWTPHLDNLQEL